MHKVDSLQDLQEQISWLKNFREGFITNFFPDFFRIGLWINAGQLFYQRYDKTVFFIRQNKEFLTLYYCATGEEALMHNLALLMEEGRTEVWVTDVVGNESVCGIKEVFLSNGFKEYTSLRRMNRTESTEKFCKPSFGHLKKANKEESEEVWKLLNVFFDPYCEQLPMQEEIQKWQEAGHILIYKSEGKIAGFIIYDLSGVTLYLRYWFVLPEFREQKVGSALFNWFMQTGSHTKRQLFWVIGSNENAIKRYLHYGFQPENMFDYVLIRK